MGQEFPENSQLVNIDKARKTFRWLWDAVALPVGYVIAFFILLFSARSSQGVKADLVGERGRLLAREWGDAILIAFILAMFVRTFFFQAFKIPSESMIHTLEIGDRLMVNKLYYGAKIPFTHKRLPGFTKPKRGDVIVFRYPVDPKKDFIKRLIAVGGETVEIRNGAIYVNGQMVVDPVIRSKYYYNRGNFDDENTKVLIPPGNYFVLGDNSANSQDSRYWGFVPEENIIGKAELIYLPLNRIRFIK